MHNASNVLPLVLDNVWYRTLDGMPLIKEITTTLKAGGKAVIIGPNGAGKSLFLRLCHGLIEPSEGNIKWQLASGAAAHQAMVFQRPVMLRRTVRANVDYALHLQKIAPPTRSQIINDVLEKTGLSRLADTQARLLSFGEQQRLALARAWALKPQVLFMDEPTASLDPSAAYLIEQLIETITAQGTKIIMTTHDLGQARRMADEVLFLHRGRLLEHAPAEQFFSAPKNDLAQAFIKGELLWWRRGEGSDDAKRHDPKHAR